jgi:hypothetical protein
MARPDRVSGTEGQLFHHTGKFLAGQTGADAPSRKTLVAEAKDGATAPEAHLAFMRFAVSKICASFSMKPGPAELAAQ